MMICTSLSIAQTEEDSFHYFNPESGLWEIESVQAFILGKRIDEYKARGAEIHNFYLKEQLWNEIKAKDSLIISNQLNEIIALKAKSDLLELDKLKLIPLAEECEGLLEGKDHKIEDLVTSRNRWKTAAIVGWGGGILTGLIYALLISIN